ncbi:MAG: rhodanese-like domain-containing protein [Acetatifactor sp.]
MEEITLEAFLALLQSHGETTYSARELYQLGVLEEIDLIEIHRPILRGSAARILHLYLKKIRRETDLEEWHRAKHLADLYDCRTCVQHIAQVVEKGIMEPDTLQTSEGDRLVFSGRRSMTENEAQRICRRAIYVSERLKTDPVASPGEPLDQMKGLTQREVLSAFFGEEKLRRKRLLVDVRPLSSFDKNHLPGAVHCPLAGILEGTYDRLFARWEEVFFYCEEGYQARIAAAYLAEKGPGKAHFFRLLPPDDSVSEQ